MLDSLGPAGWDVRNRVSTTAHGLFASFSNRVRNSCPGLRGGFQCIHRYNPFSGLRVMTEPDRTSEFGRYFTDADGTARVETRPGLFSDLLVVLLRIHGQWDLRGVFSGFKFCSRIHGRWSKETRR